LNKLYIYLFRLFITHLLGQLEEFLTGNSVLPEIARTIVIGKVVAQIKGVFKVVGPTDLEITKRIKETVRDDLHDGGFHYHAGGTVIYVKFTHEGINPNTNLPNIPIDKYINDRNPGSRGKFLDKNTYVDHGRNYIIDPKLIKNKNKITQPEQKFEIDFIPDSDQSKLSTQLAQAILKEALTRPNFKIELDSQALKKAQKAIDDRNKAKNEPEVKNKHKVKDGKTVKNKNETGVKNKHKAKDCVKNVKKIVEEEVD
jgi:hypothetical protein